MAEYISREKAFDAVFGQFCASSDETEAALNAAIEEIRAIPAADVRPVVRAHWIPTGETEEVYGDVYRCSACGCCDIGEIDFCPNCGADMRPQPPKEET